MLERIARQAKVEARRAVVNAWRSRNPRAVRPAPVSSLRPAPVYLPTPERPRVLGPSFPPAGYLGQLADEFQASSARQRSYLEPDDCYFYHVCQLPGGSVVDGPWDLRSCEADYLGGVGVCGKRILELGPASGYLTFWMESQGAEVVSFDAGFDKAVDLLPVPGSDMCAEKMEHMRAVEHVQNSWWYQRNLLGSKAKMVYGDIYNLPGDLGHFDIAFYGAILLHLRDPFGALSSGASLSDCVIVTDTVQDWADIPLSNTMRFDPRGTDTLTVWWSITPGAVIAMLSRLGFGDVTMTRHVAKHRPLHDMTRPFVDVPMYTLVARRT